MNTMTPWVTISHPANAMWSQTRELGSSGDLEHAVRVEASWCLAHWREHGQGFEHPRYGEPLTMHLAIHIRNDHLYGGDGNWILPIEKRDGVWRTTRDAGTMIRKPDAVLVSDVLRRSYAQ